MAQPPFLPEDVAALLLRDLTAEEEVFAAALAGRVWRRIISREPGLESDPPALTADVISAVVARVIQNPGGYRSELDGNYSYTLMGGDPRSLEPSTLEWQDLLGRGGAFTIDVLPQAFKDLYS